jgi:hypothetical protein
VVSAELRSCPSENPDAAGDAESWSLAKSLAESGGVVASLASLFMARSTDAASSSWTCWCFEMSSFDVTDHSGVCSHLERQNKSIHASFSQATEPLPVLEYVQLAKPVPVVRVWKGEGVWKGNWARTNAWSSSCYACNPFRTSRNAAPGGCSSCPP